MGSRGLSEVFDGGALEMILSKVPNFLPPTPFPLRFELVGRGHAVVSQTLVQGAIQFKGAHRIIRKLLARKDTRHGRRVSGDEAMVQKWVV